MDHETNLLKFISRKNLISSRMVEWGKRRDNKQQKYFPSPFRKAPQTVLFPIKLIVSQFT